MWKTDILNIENIKPNEVFIFTNKNIVSIRKNFNDMIKIENTMYLKRYHWIKNPVKANDFFVDNKSVFLINNYVLQSYIKMFSTDYGQIFFVMPENIELPEPENCPNIKKSIFKELWTPKPTHSDFKIMKYLKGDETPESYLVASIFSREVEGFGLNYPLKIWKKHSILTNEEPVIKPIGFNTKLESEKWKWKTDMPKDWNPKVSLFDNDLIVVSFYSHSGFNIERIYFHQDYFKKGSYIPQKQILKIIANASGGYVV